MITMYKHSIFSLLPLAITGSLVGASGPCDIYSSGGTPCVAAHSTTRSMYDAYTGPLYQIRRGSDLATTTISPLAGGVANAAAQDSFCSSTTCLITVIYDQSGNGNNLSRAPPGEASSGPQANNGGDNLASAIGAPVMLNGQKVYGVFISPGTGYRIDATQGIAVNTSAEGIYAVFDGTHYNGACCFDYGNAEVNNRDNGAGHMEAVYFGNAKAAGNFSGNGPWIMADLENGLFAGPHSGDSPAAPSLPYRFVHAIVKGNDDDQWAIRGGNAASGSLSTFFSGPRPAGYAPMKKEGAIILGIGGDNSDGSQGTFYEGAMTKGYPTDATENSVQANLVAAAYATTSLVSGPALTVGSSISLQATTDCCTADYITHNGSTVQLEPVSSSSTAALKQRASWTVVAGLGNSACYSFESVDSPGSYILQVNFQLEVDAQEDTLAFNQAATFCSQAGLNGRGSSIRSWNYPTRFFRHFDGLVYIATNRGPEFFDANALYSNDTTFVIGNGFAS